jgi:tRNA1Val (adenine37-N6)-methyltransferase
LPSNQYFQFKKFKIEQKQSSMKVCTDSCLFGAWIADKLEQKILNPKLILDIGSGTGLLSLMMAQKSNASIDAVEIVENSYQQTIQNFQESHWGRRLQVYHADIKNWKGELKYDLIISNPPFFENDLKAVEKNKNLAKHNDGLTFAGLIQSIKIHLAANGYFAILLPFQRIGYFKTLALENGFYLKDELLVKQTHEHGFFRGILLFGTKQTKIISEEITIKNETGNYTERFNFLLKDYYLAING